MSSLALAIGQLNFANTLIEHLSGQPSQQLNEVIPTLEKDLTEESERIVLFREMREFVLNHSIVSTGLSKYCLSCEAHSSVDQSLNHSSGCLVVRARKKLDIDRSLLEEFNRIPGVIRLIKTEEELSNILDAAESNKTDY